jgi:hypothetical protein
VARGVTAPAACTVSTAESQEEAALAAANAGIGSARVPPSSGRLPGQQAQPTGAPRPAAVATAAGSSANVAANGRRSPARVALRPQSPPRSPSQFRRDKNENATGASVSISAAGTSPTVASHSRPSARGGGGSGLMPRRLTPNSREASPPKPASPGAACSRDARARPRSPAGQAAELRGPRTKENAPDQRFKRELGRAKDLDVRVQASSPLSERARPQEVTPQVEIKTPVEGKVLVQVAELWRKLEQMQEQANQERTEKEILRQDNERLQRRVDELSLVLAASVPDNNGTGHGSCHAAANVGGIGAFAAASLVSRSSTAPNSPLTPGAADVEATASGRQTVEVPMAPRPPRSLSLQAARHKSADEPQMHVQLDSNSRSSSLGAPVGTPAAANNPPLLASNSEALLSGRSDALLQALASSIPCASSCVAPPGEPISLSSRQQMAGMSPRIRSPREIGSMRRGSQQGQASQPLRGEPPRRTWPQVGALGGGMATVAVAGAGALGASAPAPLPSVTACCNGTAGSSSPGSLATRPAVTAQPRTAGMPIALCASVPQLRR